MTINDMNKMNRDCPPSYLLIQIQRGKELYWEQTIEENEAPLHLSNQRRRRERRGTERQDYGKTIKAKRSSLRELHWENWDVTCFSMPKLGITKKGRSKTKKKVFHVLTVLKIQFSQHSKSSFFANKSHEYYDSWNNIPCFKNSDGKGLSLTHP